ncbi:MAG: N-acetylglutaminylglutamine synthetase [Piscinibacter sp.]|nr:N-acetylglutaminylglutamine synthetase [Piscinibacter sp.]
MDPQDMMSLRHWDAAGSPPAAHPDMTHEATVDCGWGRLIFGQTFGDARALAATIRAERPGRRDVALYLRDPQVVLAQAPQELFIDPSYTYRLALDGEPAPAPQSGLLVRSARPEDAEAIRRLYQVHRMVAPPRTFLESLERRPAVQVLVAQDEADGSVVGVVTGVDHVLAIQDPDGGSSLWALAVDPQAAQRGVGEALTRAVADSMRSHGRRFLDLSVLHDNAQAIALYEKLGFVRVPAYCVKRKNAINEPLYIGPDPTAALNIYAGILVREARRRGIGVEVLDAEHGYFRLTMGGRSIVCRESLTELTTAVALSRCDDKRVTARVLADAGLAVPAQIRADDLAEVAAFLKVHRRVVVKPARGEQGQGVRVDLDELEDVSAAIEHARRFCDVVVVEQMVEGEDLRIVVIDHRVVAAATRRPAEVVGDGRSDVRALIRAQSRRRQRATGGESRIPVDDETRRCLRTQGLALEDVPAAGRRVQVRKTANLHTGGTIHDVTAALHPALREAAERASRALDIPVVGFDFMVRSPDQPEHVIIEANERPGLANHEPQPTAERFIDLLFPLSRPATAAEAAPAGA